MVVMLLDEGFDVRSQVPEIFVPVRANLFALQVSMKLSQLASSYGFADSCWESSGRGRAITLSN